MIIAALKSRRPSLMAQPEWSAVDDLTLDKHPSSTSLILYLLDALAQIPSLYHKLDAIVRDNKEACVSETSCEGSTHPSRIRTLLNRSLRLLDDVRYTRTQWNCSHPVGGLPTLPFTNVSSLQPYPCAVVTHFSSLSAANAYTMCATIVILISQFVLTIYQLSPPTKLEVSLAIDHISVAVMEILSSIDYYLTFANKTAITTVGACPSSFYLLPIRVTHQVLSLSKSPEDISRKIWLEDALLMIEGKRGAWTSNSKLLHVKRR